MYLWDTVPILRIIIKMTIKQEESKMNFDFDENYESGANIKVIGVGGAGNNALNRMVEENVKSVDFIAVNTDMQALKHCAASTKILIGEKLTKGRGAGANPEVGKNAAEETIDDIKKVLDGADMVFVTAGMGGGTGTGAAPVIAKLAKDMGILTIGVVTKPFGFEGPSKMAKAEQGIANLKQSVDSIIIIPNERLKLVSETGKITILNAFKVADDVLRRGVQSITDLINKVAVVNLDFNDVSAIMRNAGLAHMGVASAQGKDKAEIAAKAAISSPLLETAITGSKGIIINFTAAPDIELDEIDYAANVIRQEANPDANIIFGLAFDPELEDEIRITLVATGFDAEKNDVKTVNKPLIEKTPEEESIFSSRSSLKPKEEESESSDDFASALNILNKRKRQNYDTNF